MLQSTGGSISDRLREVIRHFGYNSNSFSVHLGLKYNSIITRVLNDPDPERGISMELTQRILRSFPQLDERWFILGEGEMLKKPPEPPAACAECAKKDAEIVTLKETVRNQQALLQNYMKLLSP